MLHAKHEYLRYIGYGLWVYSMLKPDLSAQIKMGLCHILMANGYSTYKSEVV